MRTLALVMAFLLGASLTTAATAGSRPEPVTTCQQNTPAPRAMVACRTNIDMPREDLFRYRYTLAIDGEWEYIDRYYPCGDPAVLCRSTRRR